MTIVFVGSAPGTRLPSRGAGNTESEKVFHLLVTFELLRSINSEVLSHVLPTVPERANLLVPTPIARLARDLVSWKARDATAADNTATNGQKR
mmetsp:Transcript_12774/g.26491  ORF Transcript_12774/g.26491 Transcript_12774/m.26491 type:complete len:93 (-) Transcript_12774:872-1150(-)